MGFKQEFNGYLERENKPFLYFTMQKIVKSLDSEISQNSYNCWGLRVF